MIAYDREWVPALVAKKEMTWFTKMRTALNLRTGTARILDSIHVFLQFELMGRVSCWSFCEPGADFFPASTRNLRCVRKRFAESALTPSIVPIDAELAVDLGQFRRDVYHPSRHPKTAENLVVPLSAVALWPVRNCELFIGLVTALAVSSLAPIHWG